MSRLFPGETALEAPLLSVQTPSHGSFRSGGSFNNGSFRRMSKIYGNKDTITPLETSDNSGFGDKSIGFGGGFCLLLNNITGPGLVALPALFQQAGWLTPTIMIVLIALISSLAATFTCKAMSLIPGNSNFEGRVELTKLAQVYFPRWGFYLTHVLLFISLVSLNVSSIAISAQTMDDALITVFKWTGAVEFYPNMTVTSIDTIPNTDSPFGSSYVLSVGYVIVLLVTIPLGYYNLDDNIYVQVVACSALMMIVLEWIVNFGVHGFSYAVPVFASGGQSQVLGTIIFNYAFVTSIPSWLNEKKHDVSINKSVWSSSIVASVLFLLIGFCGSMTFKFKEGQDLLDAIEANPSPYKTLNDISQGIVFLFPITTLLTSIPIFSIVIRYNLLESNICGKFWANFWAVLFPWGLAVVFYPGGSVNSIINWSSLLVNGFINFVIPLLAYILALRQQERFELNIQSKEESFFEPIPKNFPIRSKIVVYIITVIITILLLITIGQNIYTSIEDSGSSSSGSAST